MPQTGISVTRAPLGLQISRVPAAKAWPTCRGWDITGRTSEHHDLSKLARSRGPEGREPTVVTRSACKAPTFRRWLSCPAPTHAGNRTLLPVTLPFPPLSLVLQASMQERRGERGQQSRRRARSQGEETRN